MGSKQESVAQTPGKFTSLPRQQRIAELGKTMEKRIGNEICSSVPNFNDHYRRMGLTPCFFFVLEESTSAFSVFINAEFQSNLAINVSRFKVILQTGIVFLIFDSVTVTDSDTLTQQGSRRS